MKDKIFGILQRVGRSFMLPIAILPVAGLLLGIGGSFTNETMLEAYGLMSLLGPGTILNNILQVFREAGDIIFANLPILFAMGVAIGMAKKEKEVAALSAAIAFFIMHASIGAMIRINGGSEVLLEGATVDVVGITSLQMGVFGGMLVGIGVAALHNRFYKIELVPVLSFFGGARFVPIISGLVFTLVGIVMYFVWPPIQNVIYHVGDVVLRSGYAGTWVYGLTERALIPFGLHHVFYLPFWQTAVGGTMEVNGVLVEGAQNIFFAQLADPSVTRFSVSATRFMSGKFPLMIFGLPGAALAMYRTAKPEKKKAVSGLLLSAALTSMVTGITEPLEFTFLFVAPLLYVIHCIFAGFAYMLMHLFSVGVGMTFSGGLIDLFLFGILPGNSKTGWIWIVVVGIVYFIVYYLLFSFLIQKLHLKTPGRDDAEEVKLYGRSDVEAKKAKAEPESDVLSATICAGLGGKANISDVDCCATRLRCTVLKKELVNEELLRSTKPSGVVHKGNGVQIIYGPRVSVIKSNLEEYLEHASMEAVFVDLDRLEEETKEVTHLENEMTGLIITAPVSGISQPLNQVPDEGFAQKMMGDGAVITPKESKIVAPADGVISFVFDTKHAIGMTTDEGCELLLHIGIDTVSLEGRGFTVQVEEGQVVERGEVLLELDMEYLQEHAPSLVSPVLCTNLSDGQGIRLLQEGYIQAGQEWYVIEQRE